MDKEKLTSIDQTVIQVEQIFSDLPLAYKRLVTIPDWLMVVGGLKAVTDYGFWGNTWDEKDFQQFKTAFEKAGLRLTPVKIREGAQDHPFRFGYLYNPSALAAMTANSKLVPPYDGKQPLDDYIHDTVQQGYSDEGVYGKLYSFPESAIQNYLERSNFRGDREQMVYEKFGNETYWIYPPAQPDVVNREALKEKFFTDLEHNRQFQKIMQSSELQRSHSEWRNRLPDSSQSKTSLKESGSSSLGRLFRNIKQKMGF